MEYVTFTKLDEHGIIFCFLVDQVELGRCIMREIVNGRKSMRFSKMHDRMPATKLVRSKNPSHGPGRNSWIKVTRDKGTRDELLLYDEAKDDIQIFLQELYELACQGPW